MNLGIVVARFYPDIANRLLQDVHKTLKAAGLRDQHIRVIAVPGAFELPFAAQQLAMGIRGRGTKAARRHTWKAEAVIALGAVIRGETPHFDYVCSSCVQGLQDVSLKRNVPVVFGVLTTDNKQQALERAANKGVSFAQTALEMADLPKTHKW